MINVRVAAGQASARLVTRAHGRSFYFASTALPPAPRAAAFSLYAFFRRLDDAFDLQGGAWTSLSAARAAVAWLFSDGPSEPEVTLWPADELLALRDAVRVHQLPRQPFDDMIAGMQMDVTQNRYRDEAELELYCDRVAGTVGLLMARLLGATDPRALRAAQLLGVAMQLTNILRDVAEDWARGRLYLPVNELERANLDPHSWPKVAHDARFVALIRQRVRDARRLYAEAELGASWLDSLRKRWLVLMMASIYGEILNVIERRGGDVLAPRATVSFGRKLVLSVAALWRALRLPQRQVA